MGAATRVASTWRIAAYTRWEQLSDELSRVSERCSREEELRKRCKRDYTIAETRLADAKAAIEAPYGRHWPKLFYSGSQIEQTWSCLHEAERALLMLLNDAALRTRIPAIRAAVLTHIDAHNPERQPALDRLKEIEGETGTVSPEKCERLRAILAFADTCSDSYQREIRSFRNLLLLFSLLLGSLLIAAAIVHAVDSSLISLCAAPDPSLHGNLCPNGTTHHRRFDVAQIELIGAIGGLLAAIIPLAKARRLPGPYGLAVAQSALKVVTGATTALIGIVLLQGGVLAGLSRQPGSNVLAYAAFFGLSQQILTTLVDRRASDLATAQTPKS